MLSAIVVYGVFIAICLAALMRPWLGVVGFYFYAVLDPGWNWRWAIDPTFPFQKYIFVFIVAGWLVNRLPGLKYRGRDAIPLLGLIAFLALAFLAAASALNETLSSRYMSQLWKIVLLAVIAAITIDSPKKLAVLLFAVVLAQGYNAYQINLQYFQDGICRYARMTNWGTKGDNNGYSILTVPVIAMSLAIASAKLRASWRLIALVVAVMQMHQLMLLESRGSMLGGMVLFAIFVILVPKTTPNVVAIGAFGLAGILLAGPSVVSEFSSSFAGEGERDASAESRFYLWEAGWEITRDYPLLGVGPWCGSLLVPKYYRGEELGVERKELHNLLFEISTGTGVPATICYMSFFLLPWWHCVRLLRRKNKTGLTDPHLQVVFLAVACGIPGYLIASMFSSGALLETSYVLAASGCAAVLLAKQSVEAAEWDAQAALSDDGYLDDSSVVSAAG